MSIKIVLSNRTRPVQQDEKAGLSPILFYPKKVNTLNSKGNLVYDHLGINLVIYRKMSHWCNLLGRDRGSNKSYLPPILSRSRERKLMLFAWFMTDGASIKN